MHFLITNDDGIQAPGLWSLTDAALAAGHRVTVCAPFEQQSATSHSLTITEPMIAKTFPHDGARVHAVRGTPVDCVRIGRQVAAEPVDFCLSGINNGLNAGTAVYYSGTAAAAREAAMLYIPSMAVSIGTEADADMRAHLAKEALRLALRLRQVPFPRLAFASLNAPAIPVKDLQPLRLAPLSDSYYLDGYEQRTSPRGLSYFWLENTEETEPSMPGTDVWLLSRGHLTLTFIGGLRDHNSLLDGLAG